MKKEFREYILAIIFSSMFFLTAVSCSKDKFFDVKEVVLTFDDAPNFPENTARILDVLQKHQTKATFFCIGEYLRMYPDLAHRIATEHDMGNHTYTHIRVGDHDLSSIYEYEIHQTQLLIDSLQPYNRHYFRPPCSSLTSLQKLELINKGFDVVMWDLSAEEWDPKVSTQQVLDYFHKNLNRAAQIPIILFHLNKSTYEALDILLGEFEQSGIKVITLNTLKGK